MRLVRVPTDRAGNVRAHDAINRAVVDALGNNSAVGVRAPELRIATSDDIDAMTAVMRASVLDLFPGFYNEQQVAERLGAHRARRSGTRRGRHVLLVRD